jgi:endonuclease/exonuclease/phosphatase family metal-dependent hydrolase
MDVLGGEYGDAILSKFPIKSHRIVNLPYSPFDKHEPRAALVTQLHIDGSDILFVSTHLDHMREPSDRYKQMRAIDDVLKAEQLPIILAGDFNCVPDTEPLLVLDKSWLRATDEVPSVPVIRPKHKIDHIFVHPKKKWTVVETHVIDEHIASDHLPVVATVELTK